MIMVVVDRFSKYATFMTATVCYTAKEDARLFLKNVFNYWGYQDISLATENPSFIMNFWKELFVILVIKLHFSTNFHL